MPDLAINLVWNTFTSIWSRSSLLLTWDLVIQTGSVLWKIPRLVVNFWCPDADLLAV